MSDKISIKDAQAEIDGLLVAEICRDFGINFREVYPEHILARGVGPEQAFIGLAIKRGHLAHPVARADAAAIREAALREALDAAAAETDRLRAAKKKHAHRSDIKGEAMAEGAFQVATALARLIDIHRKEAVQPERQLNNPSIRESDTAPAGLSAGGGANYHAAREAIQKMLRWQGEYSLQRESADRALAFLDDMEARNCPAPRVLLDGDIAVLTWVIGGWKLYQYCDEEESQYFRREW